MILIINLSTKFSTLHRALTKLQKRRDVFTKSPNSFSINAETFFEKPEAFQRSLRRCLEEGLETCGRWSGIDRTMSPNRTTR